MPPSVNAVELYGRMSLLGQVREGDQTKQTEAPTDLYGDLALGGIRHGITADTMFRLERDFGIDDGASDFYAGAVRVPGAIPGVDVTVGRQFVSEGPTGAFIADAGKLRIDPGWPVSFTLFGGAPRYFEPTYSTPTISRDEGMWGGSMRSSRLWGTQISVGYFGMERSDHVLRHLMTATATRTFVEVPGVPTFYGNVAYDADHWNLDVGSAGVNLTIPRTQLRFNLEGTYYKPQDHEHDHPVLDVDKREDALFELFSTSQLVQWHGALTYPLTPTLSAVANYSFQHYEQQQGDQFENSHVAGTGLLWLPGGDGLEIVKVEYYVIDGDGGSVNGGKLYYESSVYERLRFRSHLDLTGYEKESHQSDTAVSGLIGLGYELLPGLMCELNFEANHNDRFDRDFRFGFFIDYNFRQRVPPARSAT